MSEFFKFPRTPHLSWLGDVPARGDKILSTRERDAFLARPIVVEEKVDGANVGLSCGSGGEIRVQNRGNYLRRGAPAEFQPLWGWLAERRQLLRDALRDGLMLFGEWCFAVHSVRYTGLPDWFLGFDVYDPEQGRFFSTARRDRLLASVRVTPVPCIGRGRFDVDALVRMLQGRRSELGASAPEGFCLRQESSDWLEARAKLVAADFVHDIGDHWSRRPLEANRLEKLE